MSKAVLISINPKDCEKIANGENIIVKKTRPAIETPFKSYIYETKGKTDIPTFIDEEGHEIYEGSGMVIGEFICDRIVEYYNPFYKRGYMFDFWYKGWYISDLKIYDEPKELSEFIRPCPNDDASCVFCEHVIMEGHILDCGNTVKRPPQSWCYVEE